MKWRRAVLVALTAAAVAAPVARAADSHDVDADFLEFLGSVDAEDAGLNEYLEHTDLNKLAPPAAPAPPAVKPPPTVKPGDKPSPEKSR